MDRVRAASPILTRLRCASLALLAALATLAAVAPSWAETAADRAACTPSVLQLCPRAALSFDRRAALACLVANLSRASPQCQAVVRAHLGQGAGRPVR
jgi:hypothetical protein